MTGQGNSAPLRTGSRIPRLAILLLAVTGIHPTVAAEPANSIDPGIRANAKAPVKDLGDGRFRIGHVEVDSARKTITLPATVHMDSGRVEYVLVTRSGKIHEAVFVTDAEPSHVHLAALLLGIKPAADLGPDHAAAPLGTTGVVQAWIQWDRNGPPARLSLTDTVTLAHPETGKPIGPLPSGLWLYNGSRVEQGSFLADRDGSLISLIRDPDALINNPGASRDDDEIHVPHALRLPKVKTPVRVVLRVR